MKAKGIKIIAVVFCLTMISIFMSGCFKSSYKIYFYDDTVVVDIIKTKGNETLTLPNAPIKENYDFVGWYFDKGTWESELTETTYANQALNNNISVYAYYVEKAPTEYTISFYIDDQVYENISTAGNETITLPSAPTKENYDFVGWYFDKGTWESELTETTYANQTLNNNISVYAYYVEKAPTEYTISFYIDDQVFENISTAGNETLTLPSAPIKENYDFVGWYFDKDTWESELTETTYANQALNNNISVYAYYVEKAPTEYTISFYVDNQVYENISTAGNETLTLPNAPIKENYDFVGWYFDKGTWESELTATTYANQALNNNISVYAYYIEKAPTEHTISFYVDNQVYENISTAGNETITLPNAPIKENYDFVGWYFDKGRWESELTETTYSNQALNNNISVYAYYVEKIIEPTKFLVTFVTNQGSAVEPITTDLIETAPFTERQGYEFLGWFLDSVGQEKVTFPFVVSEECTLYAMWEEENKEVEFSISNGIIQGIASAPSGQYELIIPDEFNGQAVTGLAQKAFADNKNITSVTLPDRITDINYQAFRNCSNLASIKLPKNLTMISGQAFQNCSALTEIVFPNGLVGIGSEAFRNTRLTKVSLPDSTTNLSEYAFADNPNLTELDLNKVETIGQTAFQKCTSLTAVVIPDSIKLIGNSAFLQCYNLSDISLPAKDFEMHYSSFDDTAYVADPANTENGLIYIGNHLYRYNEDNGQYPQTSLTVREGTLTIAKFALSSFSNIGNNITSITLPEGLIRIGEGAFEYLSNLRNINMPSSVLYVEENAFFVTGIIEDNSQYWEGNALYIDNVLIKVKDEEITSFTVKDGTQAIADGRLFSTYASSVTSISLPDSLRYIGNENFYWCSITEVVLPESLIGIGEKAFSYCKSLQTVDTSKTVNLQTIGYSAFSFSTLSEITIPETVEYIGGNAFNQIPSITININLSAQPESWDSEWAHTYNGVITINWLNQ